MGAAGEMAHSGATELRFTSSFQQQNNEAEEFLKTDTKLTQDKNTTLPNISISTLDLVENFGNAKTPPRSQETGRITSVNIHRNTYFIHWVLEENLINKLKMERGALVCIFYRNKSSI